MRTVPAADKLRCPIIVSSGTSYDPKDSPVKTTEFAREAPWRDRAVCVRRLSDGAAVDREIVVQGSLSEVVNAVRASEMDHLSTLVISLPDRMTAPFRYVGNEIRMLLKERFPRMRL
jgi:hypothetical protein